MLHKGELLAAQPKDSGFWYLPGGLALGDESAEQALLRIVTEQTGIRPDIGSLAYVWQHAQAQVQQLELFFMIVNARDYLKIDLSKSSRGGKDLDEIGFIKPSQSTDLRPQFLQTTTLPKSSTTISAAVKFI
jgi:ADP-ribose pyrophosphatase YjhB (NUDIX family)